MKTILIATLISFAAGAAVAWTAAEGPRRLPTVYMDGRYGFSMQPPDFPKGGKDTSTMAASFAAFPKGGFASNINVMIQNVGLTMDQYRELSNGQFKQMELKILSETRKKIGGKDAILWEYEGKSQGRALHWMSLAVSDGERVFLITGSATQDDWEAASKQFRTCLDSFKFEE